MGTAQDTLEEANSALQNTLASAFHYYYVSHELWGAVTGQLKSNSLRQLQYVPEGQDPYTTAGKAGTWLGKAGKKLTRLYIVAHGKPGQFFLGQEITSDNAGPLGGWLQSFFEPVDDQAGIQIVSCNAAADSMQVIGNYVYGQAHPLTDRGLSHRGYDLLRELAKKSGQTVEGALHGQPVAGLSLKMSCRRVHSNGTQKIFVAGGIKEPGL